MGVVVRRYIDILIIIITFPYSTCISSFFDGSIPTSLFTFMLFLCNIANVAQKQFKNRDHANMVI